MPPEFPSQFLPLAAGRMHYWEHGDGDPVLFVHGNPTWAYYWRHVIAGLGDGVRCLAVDHLGCGHSDKPRRFFRLQDRIDHLVEFVERLDLGDATIVAHDWGGAIALGTVLAARARFSGCVLLNTGAWPPEAIPWRIRLARLPVLGRLAICGGNAFQRAAFRMATEQPGGLSRADRAAFEAPYANWSSRAAMHHFVQDIPGGPNHPTHATLATIERRLPELGDLPTTLVWGMRDWCFDERCLRRMHEKLPQAEVMELPSAGHWVAEDAPQAVVAAVQRIKSPAAAAR